MTKILVAGVILTGTIGTNYAHAESNEGSKTEAGQMSNTPSKGDTSKPIDFDKAKQMTPEERSDALTKHDERIHDKEMPDAPDTTSESTRSVQPRLFAAPKMRYATPNINNYIAKNNIKPAKIKEDSRIDNLPKYSYKSGKYVGVVIHETANPNSTLDGEVNYMYNNWQNAFVHAYADYKEIRQTAPADYLAWGAGGVANNYFYHIELVRAHSVDQFARSVNNQAYLAAYELKRNGLKPKLADTHGGSGTIISHNAVSKYYGGTDHSDPINYFSQWGYDMNQFYDLVVKHYNQLNGKSSTPSKGEDTHKSAIKGDRYKVVKGDTLYSISQRSGKSINDIKKWNGLKSNEIKPNQTLKLKDTSSKISSNTYQVEKKDTLYNISKRSGVSVDNIKKYNNLKSNNITVGQKLYLKPTVMVKKGETLYRVAKNNKTSVDKLKALNGLKSDTIKVGQKLIMK